MADQSLERAARLDTNIVKAAEEINAAVRRLRSQGANVLADELESRAARTVSDLLTLGELRARMSVIVGTVGRKSIDMFDEEIQREACTLVEHALGINGGSVHRLASLAGDGARRFTQSVMKSKAWEQHLSDEKRREPMIGMLCNLALSRAAEILARPAASDSELKTQERTARWVSETFMPKRKEKPEPAPTPDPKPDDSKSWLDEQEERLGS